VDKNSKIILPGGAGLVGQNLVAHLKHRGYNNLVVIDKHHANLGILRQLHPDIIADDSDLSERGDWEALFDGADIVIMLQAQIGDLKPEPFIRNNVTSTENVLDVCRQRNIGYIIHISSSVVESVANDLYTNTKKQQEQLVQDSGIDHVILRPTLMFGWFDRKHLGWLSRFMKKVPVFPIPGHGRYMRQPLYVGDFCNIIVSCIEMRITGKVYNITGFEKIDYIDIIRQIKMSTGSKALILNIPYSLFYLLLKIWALFDKNPPFTADQLQALVAHDEFEVIDWPDIFKIEPTPFNKAIDETFNHPTYSHIVLEF
jgi:nucleoside-diphosphate-sugar epimerase